MGYAMGCAGPSTAARLEDALMSFGNARRLAWLAFFTIHCGGTTQLVTPDAAAAFDSSGSSSGGSLEGGTVAAGFVASFIQGHAAEPQFCPFGARAEWIDIGAPTGTMPTTAADGANQGGERVSIACSVHATSGGFLVELNAALSGIGSITAFSDPTHGPVDPMAGGKGITGTFQSAQLGRYASSDCTIAFAYNGGPVPETPPIAPGRIWGHMSCPNAQRADILIMAPDGGVTNATCDTEADFLFENCAQ
jgi:hypothetical protein